MNTVKNGVRNTKAKLKDLLNKVIDSKINRVIKDNSVLLRSKWRKVVTGDERKRIRDLLFETQEKPENVKLFDKVAFTIGVLNISACQFFTLTLPDYFWIWYSSIVPIILSSRIYHYRNLGWEYFLLDFCYFVNFCSLVNLLIFPNWRLLFNACYILASGPLTMAIIVWRNSLVFHDFDRMTSVFIHILPAMLYYVGRFHGHTGSIIGACYPSNPNSFENQHFLRLRDFAFAALIYLFWQICYYLKTEVWDKSKLDNCPGKPTSLRWLSSDTKNALARFILKNLRKIGVFAPTEDYDYKTTKTLVVFMASQFLYTLCTFLVAIPMYYNSYVNIGYISFVFTCAIYYGGSYYIEVFSKRYQTQLEKKMEMRRLREQAAAAAAHVAYEITLANHNSNSNLASGSRQLTPKGSSTGLSVIDGNKSVNSPIGVRARSNSNRSNKSASGIQLSRDSSANHLGLPTPTNSDTTGGVKSPEPTPTDPSSNDELVGPDNLKLCISADITATASMLPSREEIYADIRNRMLDGIAEGDDEEGLFYDTEVSTVEGEDDNESDRPSFDDCGYEDFEDSLPDIDGN